MDREMTSPKSVAQAGRARTPNSTDVVFRLGTACFATWVVTSVATSPIAHLRPAWWPAFVVLGGLIAAAMLVGAFMTLNLYLRQR
jgi:hypothetical protein